VAFAHHDAAHGHQRSCRETELFRPEQGGKGNGAALVTIDAKYVDDHLGNLVKDEDLTRYIL